MELNGNWLQQNYYIIVLSQILIKLYYLTHRFCEAVYFREPEVNKYELCLIDKTTTSATRTSVSV